MAAVPVAAPGAVGWKTILIVQELFAVKIVPVQLPPLALVSSLKGVVIVTL